MKLVTHYLYAAIALSLSNPAYALKIHLFDESQTHTKAPLKIHVFEHDDEQERGGKDQNKAQNISQTKQQSNLVTYKKADYYLKVGKQEEDFDWSIAGNNGEPNVLSELQWSDLDIYKVETGIKMHFDNNLLFSLDFGYGKINDGRNQDSDYYGNNRTFEFSRSYSSVDGDVYEISAGLGYEILLPSVRSKLVPQIGYSYRGQNLTDSKGIQAVSAYGTEMPLGPFSFQGDNAKFDTTWHGPWLGVDLAVSATKKLSFSIGTQLHYTEYNAEADWILRSDLAHPLSFEQEANGLGTVLTAGATYLIDEDLKLSLSIKKEDWLADKDGKEKIYFSDGTASSSDRLNDVERNVFSANIGLEYRFE